MMRRTALALSLVLVASACGGGDDTGSDPAGGDGGGTSGPPEGVTVVVADQAVLNFQEALDIVGYDPGPIDGVYRERTTKAVQAFQADNSLAPSGDLDAETTRALFNADPRVEPLVITGFQYAIPIFAIGAYTRIKIKDRFARFACRNITTIRRAPSSRIVVVRARC